MLRAGLVLTSILVFLDFFANAQINPGKTTSSFMDARVITLLGDTLRGQIDYREWDKNPSSIVFIQQGGQTRFTPGQIQEFSVGGDTYRSARVDLDISPLSLNSLRASPIPTVVKDTSLFLLLLVQGEANLYHLKDGVGKEHFFYQENASKDDEHFSTGEESPVKELEYYRYYVDASKNQIVTRENYKGFLKAMANSCPGLEVSNKINYSSKDLINFFKQYNYCKSGVEQVGVNETTYKSKFGFYILAGMQSTEVQAAEFLHVYKTDKDHVSQQQQPVVGFGINYIIPRSREKWGIAVKAVYYRQHFNPVYDFVLRLSEQQQNVLTYKISDDYKLDYLQLTTSPRFYFSNGAWKPFISVGPSFNILLNNSLFKTIVHVDENGNRQEEHESYQYSRLVAGGQLGVGVNWKRLGLEVLYYKEATAKSVGGGYFRASSIGGQLSFKIF